MTRRNFLKALGCAELLVQSSLSASPRDPDTHTREIGKEEKLPQTPFVSREIKIEVGDRVITPRIISPSQELLTAHPLLLLNLAGDRESSLNLHPYSIAADLFLAKGHRVASFDLPNHGKRVNKYGEGLTGWHNAFADGKNPLDMALAEASAVISGSIEAGLAAPGRVVVYGISRAGYLGLRLLAADGRVAAATAVAPVTDWSLVAEFAADRKREYLTQINLSRYVDRLAGKRIFIVIGNSDDRVSTLSCGRFFLDLLASNVRLGDDTSKIEFICTKMAEPGHSVDDSWRRIGAEFLLKCA